MAESDPVRSGGEARRETGAAPARAVEDPGASEPGDRAEPARAAGGGDVSGSEAAEEPAPRARAKAQLLVRWRSFPPRSMAALDRLLDDGIARAARAEPELLTVMNPVSRPVRLRLASIAADADLDRMYHRASAELAVSADGGCYLVYRQRDGGDYAVRWSAATSLPEALLSRLPEPLAAALLETDLDDDAP